MNLPSYAQVARPKVLPVNVEKLVSMSLNWVWLNRLNISTRNSTLSFSVVPGTDFPNGLLSRRRRGSICQARIFSATVPWTSVNRKSRPSNR